MLIVNNSGVAIFDLRKVFDSGKLDGSQVGSIVLPETGAAIFVDPPGKQIVTANDTNKVGLWSEAPDGTWTRADIYEGDNPIIYAEPDATGGLLIVLEAVGDGDVHGFLYSIRAREIWFDLGTDYKHLGATFTDHSEVVVKHGTRSVFPILPLSALVSLADGELSAECRPPSPQDYRQSRCWPASYR
jgi:hypothetical protein